MAFKLKDLIISLLPGGERACPTASAIDPRFCPTASAGFCPTASAGRCPPASVQVVFCPTASAPVLVLPATPFCPTASADFCPTASAGRACPTASAEMAAEVCPTASAPGESASGAEGLAALKQQLQQALAQVEEQEKALAEPQLPQTVAEAEELEGKLREALEELRRHKESLKKR